MKMRSNPRLTALFKGFRINKKGNPIKKILRLTKSLKRAFEKANQLTDLQYGIVEVELERCTEKTNPAYVARLVHLLEKPMIKAKVDQCGNPISNKEIKEEKTGENKK